MLDYYSIWIVLVVVPPSADWWKAISQNFILPSLSGILKYNLTITRPESASLFIWKQVQSKLCNWTWLNLQFAICYGIVFTLFQLKRFFIGNDSGRFKSRQGATTRCFVALPTVPPGQGALSSLQPSVDQAAVRRSVLTKKVLQLRTVRKAVICRTASERLHSQIDCVSIRPKVRHHRPNLASKL